MDIQTTHPNTLQNNFIVSVSGTNADNKILYAQNLNQPIHPQQIPPPLISNPNQQISSVSNDTTSHSTNTISQESTIAIRSIKADPETLPQSGFETEQTINHHNDSLLQPRDGNFEADINVGNVMVSQKATEEATTSSTSNADLKDTTSNVNLKSEIIGDFNAFHEQIQTVDPVLLWSMVRSRVVPVVSCWDFLCDKSKGAYPNEEESKEEDDSGDSSLRLQTYKLQVMLEQLREVLNEMQILMLNCCEEEPLGKRLRKEDRKKKKRSRFEDGDDPYLVKMEDPILRKAFSSSSSTASGGAFRLKPDIPPQYHNVFNLDHPVVEGGGNDNWSQHPAHFMAAGNGDTSYMPLKCEYPDEGDDDELPDENDFIAPLDYIDPATQTHQVDFKTMQIKLGKDGKPKKKTGPKPKNVVAPGGPFNCKDCGRQFNNRRQVYKHRVRDGCRGTINPGPKKYKILNGHYLCLQPQCTSEYPEGAEILNTYSTREKFWKHIESVHSHPEDLLYTCDHCGKKFALKGMLKDHVVKVHDKPFVCRYCGTAFGEKATLKKHERTHTGEKPYKCEFCDFRSNSASSRSMHVKRKHDATGANKVHICELCGKGFVDKYHLKCHVLTHSSQKLFPCNICGVHQKNDSCLRSHMMRVHGLKYMCDVCGKDFSATLGLKIHQREVHQIY